MSNHFLQTLARAQLPLTVVDRHGIDLLRQLDAAGLVKAFIPAIHVDCDDIARQDPAVVLEITARGRRLLSQAFTAPTPELVRAPARNHQPAETTSAQTPGWAVRRQARRATGASTAR